MSLWTFKIPPPTTFFFSRVLTSRFKSPPHRPGFPLQMLKRWIAPFLLFPLRVAGRDTPARVISSLAPASPDERLYLFSLCGLFFWRKYTFPPFRRSWATIIWPFASLSGERFRRARQGRDRPSPAFFFPPLVVQRFAISPLCFFFSSKIPECRLHAWFSARFSAPPFFRMRLRTPLNYRFPFPPPRVLFAPVKPSFPQNLSLRHMPMRLAAPLPPSFCRP